MPHDVITQVRISGMRCLADVTLDLRGLTVLIGDNGTGKSTILEALELLRQAAKPVSFVNEIVQRKHGGLQNLLRSNAPVLGLEVTVEGDGPKLVYGVSIASSGNGARVAAETLVTEVVARSDRQNVIVRAAQKVTIWTDNQQKAQPVDQQSAEFNTYDSDLALTHADVAGLIAVKRMIRALDNIDLQVPFETRPTWQQTELSNRGNLRNAVLVENVQRLDRFGENLANCFYTLHNGAPAVWDRVLTRVRLGLGQDIVDVRFPASRRGAIEMVLVLGRLPDRPMALDVLSDGQIAYLCCVAAVEFGGLRSLLAFDEPEIHLHPALLARVMLMLEEVAERTPVVLSTHSDRLLDMLADPAKSVVLCELDDQGATRLRRPDAGSLADWLQDYEGLGEVRARGYQAHVFEPRIGTGDKP